MLQMAPTKSYTPTKYNYFTLEFETEQNLLINEKSLPTERLESDFDLDASF